jgi:AraC-like DNA-binding protein
VLYIRQHVTEKITLADLSSRFSVSKQYIARLFRLHLNTTPTAYIHRAKLESARWLLTHSTMNVTEISDYLSFSGCYYFIRLFKKHYNVTPLQYAREVLGRR